MSRDYDAVRSAKSMQDVGQHVFIPEHYQAEDSQELINYIAANPMCQLSCANNSRVLSTTLPLIPCPQNEGSYIGHMARRNPMSELVGSAEELLAVFVGPEAYVSPSWFTQRHTVPTWNYYTVQMRGHWQALNSAEDIAMVMEETVIYMEALLAEEAAHKPWQLATVDPDLYQGLLHGIVAFRFKPSCLEGIKRLNQDKDIRDINAIMQGIAASSQRQSSDVVELMKRQYAEFLSFDGFANERCT
ncbi:MAG: FMN-binding negative transcriptional regulator [Cellvibrionaceae bacterium]|nr:FMN-binding negative transcriptional regulator [Cellvibrionaceae bacterium]